MDVRFSKGAPLTVAASNEAAEMKSARDFILLIGILLKYGLTSIKRAVLFYMRFTGPVCCCRQISSVTARTIGDVQVPNGST